MDRAWSDEDVARCRYVAVLAANQASIARHLQLAANTGGESKLQRHFVGGP